MNMINNKMSYVPFKEPATTNATQNRLCSARPPVVQGPALWLNVFRTLTIPITVVLSAGLTTADIKADRGAWSIELRQARANRSKIVMVSEEGTGRSAKKTADGKCVKTIVFIKPMRLAIDPAKIFDIAEKIQVTDMISPRYTFGR